MKVQVSFGKCWLYSYTNSCFNITIEKSLLLQNHSQWNWAYNWNDLCCYNSWNERKLLKHICNTKAHFKWTKHWWWHFSDSSLVCSFLVVMLLTINFLKQGNIWGINMQLYFPYREEGTKTKTLELTENLPQGHVNTWHYYYYYFLFGWCSINPSSGTKDYQTILLTTAIASNVQVSTLKLFHQYKFFFCNLIL